MRNSHIFYRPDIDWLRAFAIISVVLFHAFPASIKGGFVGVDVNTRTNRAIPVARREHAVEAGDREGQKIEKIS